MNKLIDRPFIIKKICDSKDNQVAKSFLDFQKFYRYLLIRGVNYLSNASANPSEDTVNSLQKYWIPFTVF